MRKVTAQPVEGGIAVAVSRFGHDPIALQLAEGSTVAAALSAAGVTLGAGEQAYVSGVAAASDDVLESGDVLSIVTPKSAGN